jgi:hypothetical protein
MRGLARGGGPVIAAIAVANDTAIDAESGDLGGHVTAGEARHQGLHNQDRSRQHD